MLSSAEKSGGSSRTPSPNKLAFRNDLERERRMRKEQRRKAESHRETASSNRIYFGNMPYTAQPSDVEEFMVKEGYHIKNLDISIDPFTARNPSYCFIDLENAEHATNAMANLHGKTFLGRPLKVKPCVQRRSSPSTDSKISDRWHPPHKVGGIPLERGEMPSHEHFFKTTNEGRRLYVGGLPKPLDRHSSDADIRELFKEFNVTSVSKVKSPNESTNSKPGNHFYAFVDLTSKEEAEAAVKALNGFAAFGGHLRVHVAKVRFQRAQREREQGDVSSADILSRMDDFY